MKLYAESGHLLPRAPFDFAKTQAFLDDFSPAMGEQRCEGRALTKAIALDGQIVAFRLTDAGTVEAPKLDYSLFSDAPLTPAFHASVIDRVRFFLSLDDDLRPFYDLARDDEAFVPIVAYLYGYHEVKFPTAFENAVWAVLSQRNLMAITSRMKRALTERYGSALTVDGVRYVAFPEPARLALATGDEIAAVIGHRAKGLLLHGVARAFDGVDERWLRDAPYAEAEAWLKSIRGIGDWSAAFILLRGLGRTERIPPGERRILDAVAKVYGLVSADGAAAQRLGARYGQWIGYWAHYLRAAM